MDQLAFEWISRPRDTSRRAPPRVHLALRLNQWRVEDLVHEFELAQGLAHRGDVFLSAQQLEQEALTGWRRSLQQTDSRIPVLICSCGDPMCSSLRVISSRQADWVHWRFCPSMQPAYAGLPEFWFTRQHYDAAVLAMLAGLPPG